MDVFGSPIAAMAIGDPKPRRAQRIYKQSIAVARLCEAGDGLKSAKDNYENIGTITYKEELANVK
ncbi:MAG: hypothetical protein MK212_12730 [Saprospiraceae bacterium]|nr:hypothetical protein [Saprospiraceae bacterium]